MGIEFVSKSEFSKTPELQREYGSYSKYLTAYTKSLSQTSLMTFAKEHKDLMYSLPNKVRDDIWQQSKKADANKVDAEKAYSNAVKAEDEADSAKETAYAEYNKMLANYDEKDSKVTNAQNKYITAMRSAASAETNREILGDKMVNASKLAASAFAQGLIADSTLNLIS